MARIMVVDDSKVMRITLSRALERIGHQVVSQAKDGSEGLILYDTHTPDLVLMDINMPGLDGIETTAQLRIKHPTAIVIIISSRGEFELIADALSKGASAYLPKPVGDEPLSAMINRLLAKPRPGAKTLIADSSVTFRKILYNALPADHHPAIEARNSIDALIMLRKHPDLETIILSETCVGLPITTVLELMGKDLEHYAEKAIICFREPGSPTPFGRHIPLLGSPIRSEDPAAAKAALDELLLPPKRSDHPQFDEALLVVMGYLGEVDHPINPARLIRIGGGFFEGSEPMDSEEMLFVLEHWILSYLEEEGIAHTVWRLTLQRLIPEESAADLPRPPPSPPSLFESPAAAISFLEGCKHRGIPLDETPEAILKRFFAPVLAFARELSPLFSLNPREQIGWANHAAITAAITKNPRLIDYRRLEPLYNEAYRYLRRLSREVDHPHITKHDQQIQQLLFWHNTLSDLAKEPPLAVFEWLMLPAQPTFFHLRTLPDCEEQTTLIDRFTKEATAAFVPAYKEALKGVRQLIVALLHLSFNRFFDQLLESARRSEPIGRHFLALRVGADIQIAHLLEALIPAPDETLKELMDKAHRLTPRHWVLGSSNSELAELINATITKSGHPWKFNRVSDGQTLLRWLSANRPSHLLLDTTLTIGKTPVYEQLVKTLPYLASGVRICLLAPQNEPIDERFERIYGRVITLPAPDAILAKRLLQL